MKLVTVRNFFLVGLAFLVLMGASYDGRAKEHGRGDSKREKKCAKFVNCHDASEGRVDGRGPRTDNDNWNWRRVRQGRDDDRFNDHQRHRRHHRDGRFDRDDNWRDRDANSRDRDANWRNRDADWRNRDREMGRDRTWSRRGR
ncbi:MAG TPA: hypothetical protein VLA93_16495 [Pyrinomonadaceae bacterium]|nr:hypothetical protein [Pyrinomonadaceae bacterium]